jgi:prepilin-type N-terminal cleavage/methylation domain-containing protein
MNKQQGFSLIELLIVVAIILIIAAIAIPNLLRSRIAANEASAVGSIRTVNTGEVTYASTYPNLGFTDLKTLGTSGILDTVLGCSGGVTTVSCTKSGYNISTTVAVSAGGSNPPASTYAVYGMPASANTGVRAFYSDPSGVIRYNTAGTSASLATDPSLQ